MVLTSVRVPLPLSQLGSYDISSWKGEVYQREVTRNGRGEREEEHSQPSYCLDARSLWRASPRDVPAHPGGAVTSPPLGVGQHTLTPSSLSVAAGRAKSELEVWSCGVRMRRGGRTCSGDWRRILGDQNSTSCYATIKLTGASDVSLCHSRVYRHCHSE